MEEVHWLKVDHQLNKKMKGNYDDFIKIWTKSDESYQDTIMSLLDRINVLEKVLSHYPRVEKLPDDPEEIVYT